MLLAAELSTLQRQLATAGVLQRGAEARAAQLEELLRQVAALPPYTQTAHMIHPGLSGTAQAQQAGASKYSTARLKHTDVAVAMLLAP